MERCGESGSGFENDRGKPPEIGALGEWNPADLREKRVSTEAQRVRESVSERV